MPTDLRDTGFEFRIYTNDHGPSHVHVVKAGNEVMINLGSETTRPLFTRELRYEHGELAESISDREPESKVLISRMETTSWLR